MLMPSNRKHTPKRTLNERRQNLELLLNTARSNELFVSFTEPFRDQIRQLFSLPNGPARARLVRYIVRRSSQSDLDQLQVVADGLLRSKAEQADREMGVLDFREKLISGQVDVQIVSDSKLQQAELEQLIQYIEDARRYGKTPLGKGARTRILKLLRRSGRWAG